MFETRIPVLSIVGAPNWRLYIHGMVSGLEALPLPPGLFSITFDYYIVGIHSLVPRPSRFFSRVTLKNMGRPGDEARDTLTID